MPQPINEARDYYEYLMRNIFHKLIILETEIGEAWDVVEDMEEGQEKIYLEQKIGKIDLLLRVVPNYLIHIDSEIHESVLNEIQNSTLDEYTLYMTKRDARLNDLSNINDMLNTNLTEWGIEYVRSEIEE
jgi:hypothetical protein